MADTRISLTRKVLKTPRSAAVAGILFAILYGTALVLIRISIPSDPAADGAWLETNANRASLGLDLVPFSGIAFLWFIGLLLSVSFSPLVTFVFPLWVLAVSVYFLIMTLRSQPPETTSGI